MLVPCDHCGAKHVLDDRQISGYLRVKFRCTRCSMVTEVLVALDADRTPTAVRAHAELFLEPTAVADHFKLSLPPNKQITLTVTEGNSRGRTYTLERPLVIIGRTGRDLTIDDPEVSRWHCTIEVRGDQLWLRDLDSLNGTFIGNHRVRHALIGPDTEFRIGNSRLRLTIAPLHLPQESCRAADGSEPSGEPGCKPGGDQVH